MKIPIVLLLQNGEKYLPRLLTVLDEQNGDFAIELVVIDSGSTDNTLQIVSSVKQKVLSKKTKIVKEIKVFEIKQRDFSHGGTRNLAVKKASGEIVVFLSQDALPVNKFWLKNLLTDFSDPQVAGVFGKQIPYPQTNLFEKYFYQVSYPDKKKILSSQSDLEFSNQNLFFSNVNGAARKELLLKFPFRDDLVMSEDQFWGREVIKAGYKIIYEPEAAVYHSHNYNLPGLFRRYYWSGYSQKQLNLNDNQIQKGLGTGIGLIKDIALKKPILLPYSLLYLAVKGIAFFIGKNFSP